MVASLGVILTLALGATPPWLQAPFSADPRLMVEAASRLEAPREAELDLLLEEITLTFDDAGRRTWAWRLVFRPRTSSAVDAWAPLSIPYGTSYQARPEVRARIISPTGQVQWLDPATLVDGVIDQSRSRLYSDVRTLQGVLPAVEPGAVVEEQVVVRDTVPFFTGGQALRLAADRSIPVRSLRWRIEAPSALPLRVEALGVPPPSDEVQGSRRVVALAMEDVAPAEALESGTPPELAAVRQLAISTGASWNAVARAYQALVERQLAGAELAQTARTIAGSKDAPRDAAQKVLDWVTDKVRYTGLSFGESGLVPATPRETLTRRFGDCKDLSLLVVGLLRAKGLRASVALLRTSSDEMEPGQAGVGLFDHAVVRLDANPPIWLDPAGRELAGQLGAGSQGRLALVIDGATTALVKTPEGRLEDNQVTRVRRIELGEAGWSRASEENRYAGELATEMRRYASAVTGAEADADGRDRLQVRDGAKLKRTYQAGVGWQAALLRFEAEASRWGHTEDDEATAVVALHPLFRYLPEQFHTTPAGGGSADSPPPERRAPLLLAHAHRSVLRYEVVPPPGFRARPLPRITGFSVGAATFTADLKVEPSGVVAVTYQFESGRRLQPAEVARLWKAVTDRTRTDGPRIVFERVSRVLLDQGQGEAALAELRRLVALHPAEARHRDHLALALLWLGMGEAARAEARRAVALEPGQEWPQRVLGYILEHDLLGRRYASGADLPGAMAALQQARASSPKNPQPRGLIAQLLLQGDRLGLVGPGPRLDEAMAELRTVREELDNHDYDEDYLEALLIAGRAAEALRLGRDLPPSPRRNSLVLASAIAAGGEGSVEEVGRLPERDRGAAGEGAFKELLRCRRYAALAGLLPIMKKLEVAGSAIQAVENIGRVRASESVVLDRKDPAQLPVLLFKALLAPDLKAAIGPLMSRRLSGDFEEERDLEAAIRAAAGPGLDNLGAATLVDLAVSLVETRVEGDGPPWRLVTRAPAFDKSSELSMVMYAVLEDGLPRIAQVASAPSALARLALDLARAGDLAGARRVLGWARQGLPKAAPGAPSEAGVVAALWPEGDALAPDDVVRVASALAAFAGGPPARRPALDLEALRRKASGPAWSALTFAALVDAGPTDPGRVLELSAELVARSPELEGAVRGRRGTALQRVGRTAEARALWQERLHVDPDSLQAMRALIELAIAANDRETARALQVRLLAHEDAQPADWNNVAWARLFLEDPVSPEALQEARHAVEGKTPNAASLHTLATVEAWSGRPPAEAMATLTKGIQANGGQVGPHDWLVVGRIAERYGLLDEAAAAYRRVPAGDDRDPTASGRLAAARLKAMH